MCKFTDYQWVLVGITSFRHYHGCASGIPDGFTRAPEFSHWITDQIDNNGGPN